MPQTQPTERKRHTGGSHYKKDGFIYVHGCGEEHAKAINRLRRKQRRVMEGQLTRYTQRREKYFQEKTTIIANASGKRSVPHALQSSKKATHDEHQSTETFSFPLFPKIVNNILESNNHPIDSVDRIETQLDQFRDNPDTVCFAHFYFYEQLILDLTYMLQEELLNFRKPKVDDYINFIVRHICKLINKLEMQVKKELFTEVDFQASQRQWHEYEDVDAFCLTLRSNQPESILKDCIDGFSSSISNWIASIRTSRLPTSRLPNDWDFHLQQTAKLKFIFSNWQPNISTDPSTLHFERGTHYLRLPDFDLSQPWIMWRYNKGTHNALVDEKICTILPNLLQHLKRLLSLEDYHQIKKMAYYKQLVTSTGCSVNDASSLATTLKIRNIINLYQDYTQLGGELTRLETTLLIDLIWYNFCMIMTSMKDNKLLSWAGSFIQVVDTSIFLGALSKEIKDCLFSPHRPETYLFDEYFKMTQEDLNCAGKDVNGCYSPDYIVSFSQPTTNQLKHLTQLILTLLPRPEWQQKICDLLARLQLGCASFVEKRNLQYNLIEYVHLVLKTANFLAHEKETDCYNDNLTRMLAIIGYCPFSFNKPKLNDATTALLLFVEFSNHTTNVKNSRPCHHTLIPTANYKRISVSICHLLDQFRRGHDKEIKKNYKKGGAIKHYTDNVIYPKKELTMQLDPDTYIIAMLKLSLVVSYFIVTIEKSEYLGRLFKVMPHYHPWIKGSFDEFDKDALQCIYTKLDEQASGNSLPSDMDKDLPPTCFYNIAINTPGGICALIEKLDMAQDL